MVNFGEFKKVKLTYFIFANTMVINLHAITHCKSSWCAYERKTSGSPLRLKLVQWYHVYKEMWNAAMDRTELLCKRNNSYTHAPQSLQILKTRRPEAVAHKRSKGATKGLRVYKLHGACI